MVAFQVRGPIVQITFFLCSTRLHDTLAQGTRRHDVQCRETGLETLHLYFRFRLADASLSQLAQICLTKHMFVNYSVFAVTNLQFKICNLLLNSPNRVQS